MNTVERSSFVYSKEGNDAGTYLSKKDQLITYFFIWPWYTGVNVSVKIKNVFNSA